MKVEIEMLKRDVARVAARMANRPAGAACAPLAVVQAAVGAELARLCWTKPAGAIRESDRLREELGLDPLDLIQLALALEERLHLAVAMEQSRWRRVADVVAEAAAAPVARG